MVTTKDEIKAALVPGKIYLTVGTRQQVKALLPPNAEIQCLCDPPTKHLRALLSFNDPFAANPKVFLLYYSTLEATGLVKKDGSVAKKNPCALPNDQYLEICPHTYVFVLLCDPLTGEVDKDNHKKAKALPSGKIELLDLRKVEFVGEVPAAHPYNQLPATWLQQAHHPDPLMSAFYQDNLEEEVDASRAALAADFIADLPSGKAIRSWYELGERGEMFGWFLVTTSRHIPIILSLGRAWNLNVYLTLFLRPIKANSEVAPEYLSRFACWVFLATTIYSQPGAEGLYWYQPPGSKSNPYWLFKPSRAAKLALATMLNQN